MILLLSLILFGCYIYHLWNIFSYWRRRGVVGPTPWPIVGNYGQILFHLKNEKVLIKELYKKYANEKYIGIYVGHTPALVIKDLEMIKQVFAKDFKIFPDRLTGVAFTQYKKSIFVSPGNNEWQRTRKIFTVLSNNNKMSKILDTIQDTSAKYLDYIEKIVSVTPKQNICKLQEDLFFVIASDAMLGKKMYTSYDKTCTLQKRSSLFAKLEMLETRYCMEMMFPQIVRFLRGIIQPIARRLFSFNLKSSYSALLHRKNSKLDDMSTYTDIILELQEEKKVNDELVIDDDSIAIHLTATTLGLTVPTSNAATYLCYELATKPDIQNRCYEEVTQTLQKFDGKITLDSLSELKYLDMVTEETFRKHANAFVINRICNSKYRFPDTTVEVDPGVIIFAPANEFQHDPKYFYEPEKFIPERYSPENKSKIPACANLAFGYGPRQCIARSMSKQIIMMSVALFLQRFKIEPSEQTPAKLSHDSRFAARIPKEDEFWMNIVTRK